MVGPGEVLLELEDVLDVGAAPAVDGLVFIADHADVAVRAGEQLHQLVLRAVGVLVLVDQQVFVAAVVAFAHLGRRLEQAHGFEQQIVEVERVGLRQLLA
jgi:4-diphosphocytidyl-2C-methyl-D-erythritol kinase